MWCIAGGYFVAGAFLCANAFLALATGWDQVGEEWVREGV